MYWALLATKGYLFNVDTTVLQKGHHFRWYCNIMTVYLFCFFQEIVLGITSLSSLGPVGAVLEIAIILYPL